MNDYNDLVRKTLFRVTKERLKYSINGHDFLYKDIEVLDVLFDGVSILNMCASDIMVGDHSTMGIDYNMPYCVGGKWVIIRRHDTIFSTEKIRNRVGLVSDEVRLIRRTEILNNITNE